MLINRFILALFIISCFYLASTVNSQAGVSSCTDGPCQANEGTCEDCSGALPIECLWDVDECRNPGACCFEQETELTCEVATEPQCDGELQGEYFGDGTTCGEITCSESEPPAGPTVIIPTMNQWGIIFASIVLGAIGIVAIIREKNFSKFTD